MSDLKKKYELSNDHALEICQGDITAEKVDAIVNAANARLAHGGGVAAAISRRGGSVIQSESNAWVREHGPVPHDQPAYTSGGNMPCKYVIHAVGPVWGSGDETRKLADAIRGSLAAADQLKLASIAFPAISTGIFGFPKDLAAAIFMESIPGYFRDRPASSLKVVKIILYDSASLNIFLQAAAQAFDKDKE